MKKYLSFLVTGLLLMPLLSVSQTIYTNHFTNATFPATAAITGATSNDVLEQDGSGNQWIRSTTNGNLDLPCMEYSWNTGNPANCWYITGGLSLTAGTTYLVTVYYKYTASFAEQFSVTYGSNQTGVGQTNVLGVVNVANAGYLFNTYAFSPATSGTYYVGFNCTSAKNQENLYVDDITITSVTTCGASYNTNPSAAAQNYTVPNGVSRLRIDMGGGMGGTEINRGNNAQQGGLGGAVVCTLSVSGVSSIKAYVGGNGGGGDNSVGGAGGTGISPGGAGGPGGNVSGGGGGAASEIRASDGTTRVLVAAGGGGAAGNFNVSNGYGGAGGTNTGSTGASGGATGGKGGTASAAGGGGTGTVNGTAGSGATGGVGANANASGGNVGGGGGGGGFFGGGGGAGGNAANGGGGGGGSNYVLGGGFTTVGTPTNTVSSQGNGYVIITALPADVSIFATSATSPCSGNASTVTITSSTLVNGGVYTINYTLSGAGGNSGTFSDGSMTFGSGTGTFTIPAARLGNTGATIVTINSITISSTGCSATVSSGNTASFTVNATPGLTLGSSPVITSGTTSALLPFSSPTGTPTTYSVAWDAAALGQTFAPVTNQSMPGGSSFNLTIPAAAAAAVYNGTLTVKNASSCVSVNYPFTVTVNSAAAPPSITLGTNPVACAGTTTVSLPYTAPLNSPTSYSVVWSTAAHTQLFADASNQTLLPGQIILSIPPGAAGAVYNGSITVTNAIPLTSAPMAFTVTINALPDVSSFATSATSPCKGNASTVTVTSSTLVNGTGYNITYTLSGVSGNTGTFSDGAMTFGSGTGTFGIPSGRLSNTGATTVTINSIANSSTLCSKPVSSGNTSNFTVNPLPTIATVTTPSVVAGSTSISLPYTATNSPTTYSVTWTGAASGVFTNATDQPITDPSFITLAIPGTALAGTYTGTISVKSASSCVSISSAFTIVLIPAPVIVTTASASVCSNLASDGVNPAMTTLPNIIVTEGNVGDFGSSTVSTWPNNTGIVLVPPAGWSFNVASNITFSVSGSNITGATVNNITSGKLTIRISGSGNTSIDAVTISGVQVEPDNTTSTSGDMTLFNVGNIDNLPIGKVFGTFTIVAAPTISGGSTFLCPGTTTTWASSPSGGVWSGAVSSVATITPGPSGGGVVTGVTNGSAMITYTNGSCFATAIEGIGVTPSSLSISPSSPVAVCSAGPAQSLTANGGTLTGTFSNFVSSGAISVTVPNGGATGGLSPVTISGIPAGATITDVSVTFSGSLAGPNLPYQQDQLFNLKAPNGKILCLDNFHGLPGNVAWNNVQISSFGSVALNNTNAMLPGNNYIASLTNNVGPSGNRSNVTGWSGLYGTPNGTWTLIAYNNFAAESNITLFTITIYYTVSALQSSVTWAPLSSGLFTDASATTSYSGGNTLSVYTLPSANSTYTTTATYNACVTTQTVQVNVNQTPDVSNFSASATSPCLGSASTVTITSSTLVNGTGYTVNYTLSGAGGNTGTFNSSTMTFGGGSGTFTIPSAQLANAGATTITINSIANAASLCSKSLSSGNTASFNVNQLPSSFTGVTVGTTPACVGSNVSLTATAVGGSGAVYAWTGPGSSTINNATSLSTAGITGIALTDAGVYTVTATAPNCASSTTGTSNALVVNQLPTTVTASVTPNPACVTSAVSLQGDDSHDGTGVAYAWTGPVTGDISSASSESAGITSGALTDAGIYTLTATAAGCSGNRTATTSSLVVNVLPTTITASVTPNPACVTSAITLQGDDSHDGAGVVYAWTGPVTGHISSVSSESASIASAVLTDAGIYTLTATAAGCSGNRTATTSSLVVNVLPTTVTASVTPNPVCVTSAITLQGDDSHDGAGVVYAWTGPVTGHISSASSESASIASAVLTDAGIYTLTATAAGCSGNRTATTSSLVVNVLPTTVTASVTPNPACVTSAITLQGDDSHDGVGVVYAWTGPVTGHISSASSESASIASAVLTDAGIYTLTATAAGCPGSTVGTTSNLIVNVLPTTVTASVTPNPACVTSTVSLQGDDSHDGVGVVYAWTGPVTGDISSASSETASITSAVLTDAGIYTLTATAPGCPGSTGGTSSNLVVNVLPTTVTAAVSPNPACVNNSVTLTGGDSGDGVGVQYAWAGPVTADITDATLESTGIATVATTDAGVYTLTATAPGCSGSTVGTSSALVVNVPPTSVLPTASPNPICFGNTITLAGNVTGGTALSYSWSGPIGGITNATAVNTTIPSASLGNNGTYTLTVTAAGCSPVAGTTAAQVVYSLPIIHTFTGGGGYCAGDTGVHAGLTLSDTGITYQLYRHDTAIFTPVAGTGSAIDFGLITTPGVYYAIATNNWTSCTKYLSGITVYINPLPDTFTVTGGGSYCVHGAGMSVGLSGSVTGIDYQLYNNGNPVGSSWSGTGSAIDFGLQTLVGAYTVIGTNTATHCSQLMGTSTISVDTLPLPLDEALTGGGPYCFGDTAAHIMLSGSQSGLMYELDNNGTPVDTLTGTGTGLDYGQQNVPGTYTVFVTNTTTGCTAMMTTSVTVNMNTLPTVYSVTGGGNYCIGNPTVHVGVSGSDTGVSYQLYLGTTGTGTSLMGNTNPLDYGVVLGTGTYHVLATDTHTGCHVMMDDSAIVTNAPVLHPAVTISTGQGYGDTVCDGRQVLFTAQTHYGGTHPAYQWSVNFVPVTGGADSTFIYAPSLHDWITVILTSDTVCANPNPVYDTMKVQLSEPQVPSVFIVVNPITLIAVNQADTLTAVTTNCGPHPHYQWYRNGSIIPGATNDVYTSSNFADKDSVSCVVLTDGPCGGEITFNSVIISVYKVGVTNVIASASDIRLIPNPNKGIFTMKGTLGTTADEEVRMEVTDMLGQVVHRSTVTARGGVIDEQIQLSNTLANGMYMLNLQTAGDHKVFHFVIEQ